MAPAPMTSRKPWRRTSREQAPRGTLGKRRITKGASKKMRSLGCSMTTRGLTRTKFITKKAATKIKKINTKGKRKRSNKSQRMRPSHKWKRKKKGLSQRPKLRSLRS